MAFSEMMSELESKVADAQEKEEILNEAKAKFDEASKNYSDAMAEVENLRVKLNDSISLLFPNKGNVRQF